MRRIIGGLAGLGLIGGVGSVIYNHNHTGATVQIRGKNGQVQSVHLDFGKKQFNCPSGEDAKLQPFLIRQGRIKLTLKDVASDLKQIETKYPLSKHERVPHYVVVRAKADIKRGKRLLTAYDGAVHQYNAELHRDCTAG